LSEPEIIKALYEKMMLAPLQKFPAFGARLNIPTQLGVYVLYGAKGKVRYVGLGNLRSRLGTHLRDSAALTFKYGNDLRKRGGFRSLVIEDARHRYLLEAYATGCLCPENIGGSRTRLPQSK
jgi:hypothetical protein